MFVWFSTEAINSLLMFNDIFEDSYSFRICPCYIFRLHTGAWKPFKCLNLIEVKSSLLIFYFFPQSSKVLKIDLGLE